MWVDVCQWNKTKTTDNSFLIKNELGEDVVVHVDHLKYRVVKNDFGEDVVIHLDHEEHRLVTIDFEDDVAVHVDYTKYSVWSRMTLESTS